MKKTILTVCIGAISMAGQASVLMQDMFNYDTIENSLQQNGGFNVVGSNGAVTEDPVEEWARISNAPQGTSFGILGKESFVWNDSIAGQETLRTTWVVSDSYLKSKASSLSFMWHDASDSDFSSPVIELELDLINTNATLWNNSMEIGTVDLDISFGDDGQAFTVVTEFSAGFALLQGQQSLQERGGGPLSEFFESTSTSWTEPVFSGGMRVGAEVIGSANNGIVIEFDSVKVEAIPEPAVVTFISLFGLGLVFTRRIFAK